MIIKTGQGEYNGEAMREAGPGHHKLLASLKKNNLYQYDERPDDYIEPTAPEPVKSKRKSTSTKTYTVKRGDNLHNIAKARRTTATAIMKKNGLKSPAINPDKNLNYNEQQNISFNIIDSCIFFGL